MPLPLISTSFFIPFTTYFTTTFTIVASSPSPSPTPTMHLLHSTAQYLLLTITFPFSFLFHSSMSTLFTLSELLFTLVYIIIFYSFCHLSVPIYLPLCTTFIHITTHIYLIFTFILLGCLTHYATLRFAILHFIFSLHMFFTPLLTHIFCITLHTPTLSSLSLFIRWFHKGPVLRTPPGFQAKCKFLKTPGQPN